MNEKDFHRLAKLVGEHYNKTLHPNLDVEPTENRSYYYDGFYENPDLPGLYISVIEPTPRNNGKLGCTVMVDNYCHPTEFEGVSISIFDFDELEEELSWVDEILSINK